MKNLFGASLTQEPDISLSVQFMVKREVFLVSLLPDLTIEDEKKIYVFSFKNAPEIKKESTLLKIRLLSRASRPCDVEGPFVDDRRKLGLLVSKIELFLEDGEKCLIDAWCSVQKLSGWHNVESIPLRWTNGCGYIPISQNMFQRCEAVSVTVVSNSFYLV